jgi:molecular chaperone DnaK (HSP70)
LLKEAEEFQAEDERMKNQIVGKIKLKTLVQQLQGFLKHDSYKDHYTKREKTLIEDLVDDGCQLIDSAKNHTTQEYENKCKTIEAKFNPIMTRIY